MNTHLNIFILVIYSLGHPQGPENTYLPFSLYLSRMNHESLPLLQSYMFNLSAFQHLSDLPKLLERIRLGESEVILHLVPPAEQHIFLIFPFLVNPPPTSV